MDLARNKKVEADSAMMKWRQLVDERKQFSSTISSTSSVSLLENHQEVSTRKRLQQEENTNILKRKEKNIHLVQAEEQAKEQYEKLMMDSRQYEQRANAMGSIVFQTLKEKEGIEARQILRDDLRKGIVIDLLSFIFHNKLLLVNVVLVRTDVY